METETNIVQYGIPHDIIMDTLHILLQSKLKYCITAIKETENIIVFEVTYTNGNQMHQQVEHDLEDLIWEYIAFMGDLSPNRESLLINTKTN